MIRERTVDDRIGDPYAGDVDGAGAEKLFEDGAEEDIACYRRCERSVSTFLAFPERTLAATVLVFFLSEGATRCARVVRIRASSSFSESWDTSLPMISWNGTLE